MATQPLFVASLEELKANLRLSGLDQKPNSDANELLEQALQSAIVRFYSELTEAQILAIQTTPFVEQPTSAAEAQRMLANLTEIRMVRLEAMRVMPVRFMDTIGSARQDWNQEAPLVDSLTEQEKQEELLQTQIADAFSILSGEKDLSAVQPQGVRASTIGPTNSRFKGKVAVPGGTIFPCWPEGAYIPLPADES